jgi:DNA excision repair protein ERCC-2
LEFYFEAARFARLALELDDDTLFDVAQPEEGAWPITGSITGGPTGRSTQSTLCLRNVTPGKFLAPRWAAARATVLYSATLSPPEFHRQVLGLPAQTARTDVESPFSPEQLTVRLVHSISTRFRDRARSIDPIAHLMAEQYSTRPGNYLAFFASFDYLRQVAEYFEARHPQIPVWRQQSSMPERERQEFMDRFVPGGRGVGFAVLGGAFAEGIDLTGDRLIGAFIATLGLPQINPINEEMQRRMQLKFGAGYEYTYLYPGLQKVVQAAGRVIRTPEDRGIVYLIDDRFTQTSVRRLLPTWWTTTPLAFRTSAP